MWLHERHILLAWGDSLSQAPPLPQAHYLKQPPPEVARLPQPPGKDVLAWGSSHQGALRLPLKGKGSRHQAVGRPPQTQALLQVRAQLHSMMTRERRHGSWGFRSRAEGGRELLRETEATDGGSGAPAAL